MRALAYTPQIGASIQIRSQYEWPLVRQKDKEMIYEVEIRGINGTLEIDGIDYATKETLVAENSTRKRRGYFQPMEIKTELSKNSSPECTIFIFAFNLMNDYGR